MGRLRSLRVVGSLDHRLAAAVALVAFSVYVAISYTDLRAYDGRIMAAVSRHLVTALSLETPPGADPLGYATPYTAYGVGMMLLMAPASAVEAVLDPGGQPLVSLVNPLVLAATAAMVVVVARHLAVRRWLAAAAGLSFAFATTAVVQSIDGLSEPAVGLLTLLAVWGVHLTSRGDDRGLLLVGWSTAAAMLFRPDSVLLVGVAWLALPLVVRPREVPLQRLIGALVVPMVLALGWQVVYDLIRFGDPFDTGYDIQAKGRGFDMPLAEGLGILLASPGKGMFWFNPPIVLGVAGIAVLWRSHRRAVGLAIALVVLARVLLYARWFLPAGDVAFGPRLVFPAVPALMVAAAVAVEHALGLGRSVRRTVASSVAAVTVAAGLVVSFASVAVDYPRHWEHVVHGASDRQAAMDRWYWSPEENHVVANLTRYGPPYGQHLPHLRDGPDPVAWGALVLAALGAVQVVRLGRRGPPTEGTAGGPPLYPS